MEREPIGKYMKIIHLSMEKDFNRMVIGDDLTSAQCDLLFYLKNHHNEEVNPVDIEREFSLSRPTVAGILHRLRGKGFITFKESSKDRRYKQVILTEKTEQLWGRMEIHIAQVEKRMRQGLSEEEQETFIRLLKRILKNVTD